MSSPAPFADARARLAAAFPATPISWPNETFVKPEPPGIWLGVEMTGDVLMPIELGGGAWQEEGRLFVHVIAPAGTGSEDARATAKDVANVFRGVGGATGSLISYYGASIGYGAANDESGNWWRLTVVVDWRYQDVTV